MKVLAILTAVAFCIVIGCDAPPEKASAPDSDSSGSSENDGATDVNTNSGEERTVAKAGVGKEGQNSRRNVEKGGVARMITQPAHTLFSVKQKAVFDIQIPHAMNLYRATDGDFPKSHDEFMKHIIEANKIKLPELPEGQRYEYDAQSSQLMVVKPEGT
jgi:hypothetical protein